MLDLFAPPPVADAACDWPSPARLAMLRRLASGEVVGMRRLYTDLEAAGVAWGDSVEALRELVADGEAEKVFIDQHRAQGVRRVAVAVEAAGGVGAAVA